MKKLIFLSALALVFSHATNAKQPSRPADFGSDFSLKNVNGEYVSLSKMENTKGYILVFSCNTCPVVKKYEKRLIDLHNKFSGKGYPVVAVNSNDANLSPGDSFEEMKKVASANNYPFLYLYDETQDVAKEYGATNTPHVFVVSKQNNHLKIEYAGAIDNNADDESSADKFYVKDAVNALLKGQQVEVAHTKAVGCGIKWNKTGKTSSRSSVSALMPIDF